MAGLPGTDLLHTGRDRGLTCQPPGETSGVSVYFTVFTLWFCTITWQSRSEPGRGFPFTYPLKETNRTILALQTQVLRYYQIMKSQCHLAAHSNVMWFSCWISHVPAKMRRWWICLPSRAICIVHYTARLDPCAWMGMGNWTRPGASSMQLLSLGRRSSTESGLKSAWDTWHYQLRFHVNWEIWSPEATRSHRHVRGSLGYVCLFCEWEGGFDKLQSLCLCVRLWSCSVHDSIWSMRRRWSRQWGVCVNNGALVSTMNPARDWWRWITELGALQCWIRGWAGSRDSIHQYAVN